MWSRNVSFKGRRSVSTGAFAGSGGAFRLPALGGAAVALGLLAGCTVQPLNSSTPVVANSQSASINQQLRSTAVSPVSTRVGQQVRNALLFSMNGGSLQPGGNFRVDLQVSSTTATLSVQTSSLAPTSAQVRLTANYQLVDIQAGRAIAKGKHFSMASFEKTPQSFANERAERDAQNRAARDVAQRIKLSVAQALAAPKGG